MRAALRNELANAQIDARNAKGTDDKSWMFFLPTQDPTDPRAFRIRHHSNHALIAAAILPLQPTGAIAVPIRPHQT